MCVNPQTVTRRTNVKRVELKTKKTTTCNWAKVNKQTSEGEREMCWSETSLQWWSLQPADPAVQPARQLAVAASPQAQGGVYELEPATWGPCTCRVCLVSVLISSIFTKLMQRFDMSTSFNPAAACRHFPEICLISPQFESSRRTKSWFGFWIVSHVQCSGTPAFITLHQWFKLRSGGNSVFPSVHVIAECFCLHVWLLSVKKISPVLRWRH